MPLDGSNNYQYPPGTRGIPDQTIESEAYNTFLDDLVWNDLNVPRPIHRGGTGGNTADAALTNLSGEKANQLVTNYNSHVFLAGSFWSDIGATATPEGLGAATKRYTGICYGAGASDMVIHARDFSSASPGPIYVRQKNSGVWGVWVRETATDYVLKAGDTMTGDLSVTKNSPTIFLKKQLSGQSANIVGALSNNPRWIIQLGDDNAEGGPAVGSNFNIQRYNNVGAFLSTPYTIARDTGYTTLRGDYVSVIRDNNSAHGLLNFGSTLGKYIFYDGTVFSFAGGGISSSAALNSFGATNFSGNTTLTNVSVSGTATFSSTLSVANQATFTGGVNCSSFATLSGGSTLSGTVAIVSDVLVQRAGATYSGMIKFGNTDTKYILMDSSNFYFSGAGMRLSTITDGITIQNVSPGAYTGTITMGNNAAKYLYMDSSNWNFYGGQLYVRGTGGNIFTDGNGYKPGGGPWVDFSDARIKTVNGDYTNGLTAIKQLHPVRYVYKGNDLPIPLMPPATDEEAKTREVAQPGEPHPASTHYYAAIAATEYIGLIAQEAEVSMPELVSKTVGKVDGVVVNDLRNLDPGPLLFALVNAVKELAARVEQLEAAG